jgi:hypothetical protein
MVVLEGDAVTFSWTPSTATPPSAPVTYKLEVRRNGVLVVSYSGLSTTSMSIPASLLAEGGAYTWRVFAMAGSSSRLSTSTFTLNVTHTDNWVVVTPGPNEKGDNIALIFYNPNPGAPTSTLQFLRQIAVEAGGELIPAVGDIDLTHPGKELAFGGGNWVYVYGTDGSFINDFNVFDGNENPSGRVHVAVGDVDSTNPGNEIIVGSGPAPPSRTLATQFGWVKIFTPSGQQLRSFKANESGDQQMDAWVAAGDLFPNEPGDEIVCGMQGEYRWLILVYRGDGSLILSVPLPTERGIAEPPDMTVAVGDFTPTNAGNEILAGGYGGFNEVSLLSQSGTLIAQFPVFSESINPLGSVRVAAALMDNIGGHEIVAGTGFLGEGYLQVLKSDGSTVVLQQVLPPELFGGEVHVAGNR